MAPGGQGTSIADSRPTVVKELRENFPDLPVVEVGSIPFDKTEADFKWVFVSRWDRISRVFAQRSLVK